MTDPAAAREMAREIVDTITMKIGTDPAKIEMIAAALIAAEQRGREAATAPPADTTTTIWRGHFNGTDMSGILHRMMRDGSGIQLPHDTLYEVVVTRTGLPATSKIPK